MYMTNEEFLSKEIAPKVHPNLQEDLEYFLNFLSKTQPKDFLEYSEENSKKVEKMDPHYIVTDHDTCDSPQYSVGHHDFGPEPSCCWVTHGWHILTNPWPDSEDMFRSGGYDTCIECNIDGDSEDEGDPDCQLCFGDGWANYYFD